MAVDQLQQTSAARPAEPAGKSNEPADTGSNAEGRRRTLLFAAIVGGVILLGALGFWLYSRTYESTDDAQVDGHVNSISARISGHVIKLNVDDNPAVTQKYGIMNIPTMSVFKNGEVVKEIVGAKPKSALLRELADFI